MRHIVLTTFKQMILICCLVYIPATGFCGEEVEKIIAFGDSITTGFWENTNHNQGDRVGGYEPDLEKLTEEINNLHHVHNYGLGGERTTSSSRHPYPEGGIHRLKNHVLPAAADAKYILIMEGTNDYWDGITPHATRDNLEYMINLARSYNIIPIIGTLTPDTRSYAGGKKITKRNELIREMAAKNNVPVADFYPQMIDDWNTVYAGCAELKGEPDTVHPCRAGYAKIAQIWFETLNLPVNYKHATSWLPLLLDEQ